MQSLIQDLRYGARLMRRNPGFTLAVVATLALGIGVNTAIFSIVNVLTMKPLAYHDPSRVAFVLGWDNLKNESRFNLRQADFLDLRRQAKSLENVAAYSYLSANLSGTDVPDRVQAYRVTPNTFTLLGVPAATGRAFDDTDLQSGRLDLAVISHGLWQRRFGSDPSIVGRRIVVNGTPHEVVGVMPKQFEYPVFNFKGDLWIPWQIRDAGRGQASAADGATVVGRLKAGVSYAQAQSELDVLMSHFAERYPETNRDIGARVTEMGKLDDEQAGPAIAILLVTVSFVLLLACANVANLLLARSASRHRELAVRAAIGASRLRIGRQLLIEGVLLAAAGGGFGVWLAFLGLRGIKSALPDSVLTTVPNIAELGIDLTTLGYTLGLSLLASLVFGLLPAWRAARDRFEDALKESASAGGSRGTKRLRSALVISEVALATTLMVGAGLLVKSYDGLKRIGPGFDSSGVMTMALTLPDYAYADATARRQFFDQVTERVERLPGVTSAGFVNVMPFSTYDRGTRLTIDGAPVPEPGREPSVSYRVTGGRYLQTLKIPLVEGRYLDHTDTPDGARVALVNQTLARGHLHCGSGPAHDEKPSGSTSCVGRRIRLGNADAAWLTIVGVVGDVHHWALTQAPAPEVYVPMSQAPSATMMLAARALTRPEDLTAAIRAAIRELDPAQPVYHVKTLETLVGDSALPSQVSANLMALFSALALALAAIGIYGVVAYGVSQQAREFGVRMALGATRSDVLRLVLRSGGRMVGVGIGIGMAGATVLSRLIQGALVGVSPTDPLTYATVAAVLAATGLAACTVPALRASGARPVNALRMD